MIAGGWGAFSAAEHEAGAQGGGAETWRETNRSLPLDAALPEARLQSIAWLYASVPWFSMLV